MKISVFTVCMPEFTPEEAARKLSEWGYDGVEWRVATPPAPGAPLVNYWNGNRCSVDPATLPEQAANLRALCRRNGLAMPVLASYLRYDDLKLIERVMSACAILGTKCVRVGSAGYDGKTPYDKVAAAAQRGWQKVAKLARKHKVRAVAELHMGTITASASAARRFLDPFDPAEVGAIYDPSNLIFEGVENWQMGLEILGRYLAHVHVKNGAWSIRSGDPDGNLRWRYDSDTLRRGLVNWCEVIAALRAVGYDGWMSMEDFGPEKTEPKLKDDIRYLRRLLKAAR